MIRSPRDISGGVNMRKANAKKAFMATLKNLTGISSKEHQKTESCRRHRLFEKKVPKKVGRFHKFTFISFAIHPRLTWTSSVIAYFSSMVFFPGIFAS